MFHQGGFLVVHVALKRIQFFPGVPLYDGLNMNDIFRMVYPKLSKKIDFQIIQDFINASYILSLGVKDHSPSRLTPRENTIYLKGKSKM